MKRRITIAAILLLATGAVVLPQGFINLQAVLTGYQEVPAVSTTAGGDFRAQISPDETSISWTMSYSATETPILFAHIHFGQEGVNGGVSAFLCGGGGTPPCPPGPATLSGTITAANVIGPAAQGIEPGSLAELIAAMRAGRTYANVHTMRFPGGEIRGQLLPGRRKGASVNEEAPSKLVEEEPSHSH